MEFNKPQSDSAQLYDVLRNKWDKLVLKDKNGQETLDQESAVQFDLYIGPDPVTITLIDPQVLKVHYVETMIDKFDEVQNQAWRELLRDLRKFTVQNVLQFDLHNQKSHPDTDNEKLDLAADKQEQEQDETLAQVTNESRFSPMFGSSRSSRQVLERVTIKVRHRKPVDENVRGARSRNFSKIFIETVEGERFKFPYPVLAGARAMARHLEEGGNWSDRIGQHILDLTEKVMTIKEFSRYARRNRITEQATPVVLRLSEKLNEYKKKLALMQGSRGYHSYKSTMVESYVEPVDHVSTMFSKVDEQLMKLMPAVERILGERERAGLVTESVASFVDWINTVDTLNESVNLSNLRRPPVNKYPGKQQSWTLKQLLGTLQKLKNDPEFANMISTPIQKRMLDKLRANSNMHMPMFMKLTDSPNVVPVTDEEEASELGHPYPAIAVILAMAADGTLDENISLNVWLVDPRAMAKASTSPLDSLGTTTGNTASNQDGYIGAFTKSFKDAYNSKGIIGGAIDKVSRGTGSFARWISNQADGNI